MKLHKSMSASLLLLPLLGACAAAEPPAAEQVRPVRSTIVGASDDAVGARYSGQVRARHEVQLGFQTSGRVLLRLVDAGSRVKRGQPLLRLDPAQENLHLAAAAAEVEAARSRVTQDRIDLQRTEQLLARQFASQAEVDQQRLALQQAQSQLESALAQQQIKANQRDYTELLADRDGWVLSVDAEVGEVVAAGQPVVTIAGDGDREVLVSIPESRVDELRQAQRLQVSLWAYPQHRYNGELRELAPDTDSITRTYSARIRIVDADERLRLGMTATVLNPDTGDAAALRLPLTAIYDRQGQSHVWVLDPASGAVQLRPVQLAGVQDDQVRVAAGLQAGETVVTAGVHMLHEGQKVASIADATENLP